MHGDYSYPSVYFAYFLFFLLVGGALYFFLRSWRDGYWGSHSEDVKYRVLEDELSESRPAPER
jgi:hypothetical protein